MMSRIKEQLLASVGEFFRDLLGLAGALSIAYGAWLIYNPAGYIVGGVLVLAGTILSSKR